MKMRGEIGRPKTREAKVRYPGFRDRLQEAMRRLGVSRVEMAKKLGATDATFGNYYNGERIPAIPKYQQVICDTLNVTWDYLARGVEVSKGDRDIKEVRVIQIPVEDLKDLRAFGNFWERVKKYLPEE
jgi:transcriptional regulator with XRE-family HTH domain